MSISRENLLAQREKLLLVLATGAFAAVLCFVTPTVMESVDYLLFYKPNFQFLADAVHEGRLPLWNPYIGLGRPFLADTQNAVFYPPVYLICLGQGIGVFLLVWLHCLLAAIGMSALAGALQVGKWQGWFMAFCFLASGALTARWMTGQLLYCCAVCYVPSLFCCALRTDEPWHARRIAKYAGLLALQFLCGHPQVFWFSCIGQAAFIFGRATKLPVPEAARDAGRALLQFGAACVWCAGLVAVVLLPFLELAAQGNRAGASPEFVNFCKLDLEGLATLFSPIGISSRYWINWERNLFVGFTVLVTGLGGLSLVRERNVRGFLSVSVVALLSGVGDSTPLFDLFYKWLPGYSSFRLHSRTGLLIAFALICTAGIWLSRPHPKLREMWTTNFQIPIRSVLIGLVLLQALDLLRGTWTIKNTYVFPRIMKLDPAYPFQQTLIDQLRKQSLIEPFQPPPRVCVPATIVPANYGMIHRYANFDGYTSLFLRRPWDYLHAVLGIQPPGLRNTSVSDEIYARGPFPYRDVALSVGFDPVKGTLLSATNPAPRAFLVYAAQTMGSSSNLLAKLAQGYDIQRCALVESPLVEPLPAQSDLPATGVIIRRFEPNSISLEVEAGAPALLVLAEAWYPGWRAEIDGQVRESVPANVWMRAFPVPAGRHQVRVYFRQNYLGPGFLVSLVGAVLLVGILTKPKRPTASERQTAEAERG